MGTKVHSKTFLPEHCTAGGEVNVDGTGGWPVYYDDRALSMQFCNGFASMLIGCPGYEKEVLKQTMLKHEAIFRTQVYELHRLYRIQRELTEELKRKDFCSYSTNVHASQSSTMSSKWSPLKSPCLPVASSSFSRPSSASIYNSQKAVKDFSTEAEVSPVPSENSFWYKSDALKPEPKRLNNSIVIDLRLPGDTYLDVENTKGVDAEAVTRKLFHPADVTDVNCNMKSEKDTMLTLNSSKCDGLRKLSSVLHSSPKFHNLSDVNTPVRSSSPLCQEGLEHHLNLFNQERKIPQAIHFERGFPSFLEADGGVKRQKLWFSNHEHGNTSDVDNIYGESAKKFAEYEQFKPMKAQDSFTFALSNQGVSETRFKETSRLNGSGKILPANSICTVLTMPQMTCPVPLNPSCSNVNITLPSVTSVKDFNGRADNVPASDDQSTCFIGSTSINKSKFEDMSNHKTAHACDKQKFNISFSHSSSYHDSVPSEMIDSPELYLPIGNSGKQNLTVNLAHPSTNKIQLPLMDFHSSAGNPVKGIDLNMALPGDLSDTCTQQNVASDLSDGTEEHASGMSWLLSKTPGDRPICLTSTSQTTLFPASGYFMPANNIMPQDLKVNKVGSSLLLDRVQPQKKEISCVPGYKKIFGVAVLESSFKGVTTTDLHPAGSASEMNNRDLENQLPEEIVSNSDKCSATGGRPAINLNSTDSFTDCVPKSSGNLAAEEKVSMISSDSSNAGRSALVIDLELPAELFSEEPMVYQVDALEGHFQAPVTVTTDTKESELQEDTITKMAAETIVTMSSKICKYTGSIGSSPLDQISADNLHWFADVISSHICTSDGSPVQSTGQADGGRSLDHDGLDFFEAMTLNLVEAKVDDLLPTIPDKENRKEDTSSISLCLLTKARRGQARKRRQRRDFQKDVLPGLASLSRHEVSEDIQTIGGMMRAVGQPWQSGVGRRTTGRNAGGCQAKGRRRQRGGEAASVPVVVEVPVESPPRKEIFAEFEIDARSIMGWGRTRRCRRPRCPPGISVPPLP